MLKEVLSFQTQNYVLGIHKVDLRILFAKFNVSLS